MGVAGEPVACLAIGSAPTEPITRATFVRQGAVGSLPRKTDSITIASATPPAYAPTNFSQSIDFMASGS